MWVFATRNLDHVQHRSFSIENRKTGMLTRVAYLNFSCLLLLLLPILHHHRNPWLTVPLYLFNWQSPLLPGFIVELGHSIVVWDKMMYATSKGLTSLYSPKLYTYSEPKELKEAFFYIHCALEKRVKRWHYHVSESHTISIDFKEWCNLWRLLFSWLT